MSKIRMQKGIFSKYAQQKYSVHLFDDLFADGLLKISTTFIELFILTYERNMTVFFLSQIFKYHKSL